MTSSSPSLDRILANDYLADLQALPIEEIRAMRADCQAVEVDQSYLRRLAQGRLDIVAAELRHRNDGGEPSDAATLIDELPEILADHVHAPGVGRLPTFMAPSEGASTAELDAIIDANRLGNLEQAEDDEIRALIDALTEFERDLSSRRKAVHERIDALQAELTRRYKTGEASVESLLR